jgi:ribosomal peptide maturation radical SAM protein 1
MPAKKAARHIWELHRRYRTNRLMAMDLIMSLDHVQNLLPELARLRRRDDSDLRLFYETKSNLTRAQLESFSAAGVTEILAGIESMSTGTLRRMRKGVRAIQNVQTLKWGLAFEIKVVWNYLYGFPGEDPGEYDKAVDALLSLTHLQPPASYAPVRPERFSPYRESFADFGLKGVTPDPVYAFLYPRKRFDLNRLAYSFEFAPGAVLTTADRRVARLRDAVRSWAEVWPRNFFASRRGVESVELFDSRPLGGGGGECREHTLTGLEAAIYRRCETIATLGEVVKACSERDPAVAPEEVRRILDEMTGRRWLWREDNFYLALAVPVSGLPPVQRHRLEMFQLASQQAFSFS